MLVLELDEDRIHSIQGRQVLTAHMIDLTLPCVLYKFHPENYHPGPISYWYEYFMYLGYSPERIIDELLDIYLRYADFRNGRFRDMALILGFIGMRGSGKTCSQTRVAILDYLLKGVPVWSNYDISVRVVYKDAEKVFRSLPIDKNRMLDIDEGYRNGLLVVDEVNLEAGESSRYMSGANLAFGHTLQQLRKRNLSMLYTCQSWSWLDARIKWQTDFAIQCNDASLSSKGDDKALGEYCNWRVFDTSGLTGTYDDEFRDKNHYLTDLECWKGTVMNKPFWFAYDTDELQGQDGDYVQAFKAEVVEPKRLALATERAIPYSSLAYDLAQSDIQKIYCADLWRENNITDRATMTKIGTAILKWGFVKSRDSQGYFYERDRLRDLNSWQQSDDSLGKGA